MTAQLTPYFVKLPDMQPLSNVEPRMANPRDGCFLMPRSGTVKSAGLPTLLQADVNVDFVYQAIFATPEWSSITTALNQLQTGVEWVSTKFAFKTGTNYNNMPPVQAVCK